uniref:Uncharacterized protein n=1 Tax=Micrurus surinamensis TaxID=129470 RepID=A0A2D4NTN9_MICSU
MDEEVYNMYCFVIQDKSPFIESKLKVLHNITTHLTHITESNAFGICEVVIIGIVSCICVKSLTLCELCNRCCKSKKAVQSSNTFRKQEIMMMLSELDSQM